MTAIAITAAILAPVAPAVSPDPYSYWAAKGCEHGHRSAVAYKRIRHLVRHTNPYVNKRAVRHFARCLATRAKAHEAHERARAHWAWRHQYSQLWEIRRNELDAGILGRLAVLRGCETRGIAYPANYQYSGHHHGAYQYLVSTWQRAEGYYAAVTGRKVVGWTGAAYSASPAHQDVVTAVFFPAHSGEWACSA